MGMDRQRHRRIVLVESEAGLAQALSQAMTNSGFTCEWVRSAGDLTRAVAETPADLVMIDGLEDGPDQRQLCRTVRESCCRSDVKIVVLNGSGRAIERRRCQAFGADAVLVKPFGLTELREAMGTLLGDMPAEAV